MAKTAGFDNTETPKPMIAPPSLLRCFTYLIEDLTNYRPRPLHPHVLDDAWVPEGTLDKHANNNQPGNIFLDPSR